MDFPFAFSEVRTMPPFVTVPELAAALRVSPWSVYRNARAGRIPYSRLGDRGKLLFNPVEVIAALQRNGRACTADRSPA
jgi:hypothetical protein